MYNRQLQDGRIISFTKKSDGSQDFNLAFAVPVKDRRAVEELSSRMNHAFEKNTAYGDIKEDPKNFHITLELFFPNIDQIEVIIAIYRHILEKEKYQNIEMMITDNAIFGFESRNYPVALIESPLLIELRNEFMDELTRQGISYIQKDYDFHPHVSLFVTGAALAEHTFDETTPCERVEFIGQAEFSHKNEFNHYVELNLRDLEELHHHAIEWTYDEYKSETQEKVPFIKRVKQANEKSGWAWHYADNLSNDMENDGSGREWQFRIAIKPTKENLNRAANALEMLCSVNNDFKCFIFADDNAIESWDGTQIASLNDGSSDRDQRGKEVCVYMRYDTERSRYERTPYEWKVLMLSCWKALINAGVETAYTTAPFGDREIPIANGRLPSPFSYTSFKPWRERHGILHSKDYNPHAYVDPLEGMQITTTDLRAVGINPAMLEEIQDKRVAYLEEHSERADKMIKEEFYQIQMETEHAHRLGNVPSIDELLLSLKNLFAENNNMNLLQQLQQWIDLKAIVQQLADRFPRVANSQLTQNPIIAQWVSDFDRAQAQSNLNIGEFISSFRRKNAKKILDDLFALSIRDGKKEEFLVLKEEAEAVLLNSSSTELDIVIEILRIQARKEIELTTSEISKISKRFIHSPQDTQPANIYDDEKEKGKEIADDDDAGLNIGMMVEANAPKMQLLYRKCTHLEREGNAYAHELDRSRWIKEDKNQILEMLREDTCPSNKDTFISSLDAYSLPQQYAALQEVKTRRESNNKTSRFFKENSVSYLEEHVEEKISKMDSGFELMELIESLIEDLESYIKSRQNRLKDKSSWLFRWDNPVLTKKKSEHATLLKSELEKMFTALSTNVEYISDAELTQKSKEMQMFLDDAMKENKNNEHAHWKFHYILPTTSHLEKTLRTSKKNLELWQSNANGQSIRYVR